MYRLEMYIDFYNLKFPEHTIFSYFLRESKNIKTIIIHIKL